MNFTGTAEPGVSPTQDDRTWGMLAHLSAFVGVLIPIGSIIAPLVIWLVKKDQSLFVAENARESLNFNITIAIAILVSWALTLILIGILMFGVVVLYWLVMTILASIKANEGNVYRYGISLRLVK